MDTVQLSFAAPPAAASTSLSRGDAASAVAEVSGVMPRGGDIPLPIPANFGQTGEVNKSRMVEAMTTDLAPERVMKPWGLPMLPDLSKQDASRDEAETETQAEAETVDDTSAAEPKLDAQTTAPPAQTDGPEQVVQTTPEDPAKPATDPYMKEPETT